MGALGLLGALGPLGRLGAPGPRGALGALGHWPSQSLPLILPLLAGGAIGAMAGQRLAPHLSDRRLRQGFSILLISSAVMSGLEAWKRQPAFESNEQAHLAVPQRTPAHHNQHL